MEKMKSSEKVEKDVILTFDAMTIEPSIRFDDKNDRITGFQDQSTLQDSSNMMDASNSLLVFMLRGINQRWKQPIGYVATRNGVSAVNLQKMLIQILYQVNLMGLRVSYNRKLPFFRHL